ncbi:hypothetical protein [Nocardioides mangrovi]|uniref:DUF4352 domain-containing protein n=1 Tax=Nocardioides mangrovi TaxID=2874580 RepID=A0ABS7UJL4_9ACTN|nr:hypothetical protein [Nocardioides mangrovi]MBZ5741015.1 hypothetical protein [Nocardioides mangrovi]
MTRRSTRASLLALALAGALAVAGCSSSDDDSSDGGSPTSPSGSTSATPYLPVPDGVQLTPPGTHLSVGDEATVAWEPRQNLVGTLDITVSSLEKTTIKDSFGAWQLSSEQQKSTPYFVRATVKNVGDTDLGGRRVPLYVVNDQNVLLESTPFASAFAPCPSTALPDKFKPGAKEDVCLVYLAPDHGQLDAVSFRPEETFDPIIWTGDVTTYKPAKDDGKKKSGKKKG